jgi:hypothetical protein
MPGCLDQKSYRRRWIPLHSTIVSYKYPNQLFIRKISVGGTTDTRGRLDRGGCTPWVAAAAGEVSVPSGRGPVVGEW